MILQSLNQCKTAIIDKDYISSCQILHHLYSDWSVKKEFIPKSFLERALSLLERIVNLPEIEESDYILGILAEERVFIESSSFLHHDFNALKNHIF